MKQPTTSSHPPLPPPQEHLGFGGTLGLCLSSPFLSRVEDGGRVEGSGVKLMYGPSSLSLLGLFSFFFCVGQLEPAGICKLREEVEKGLGWHCYELLGEV